MQLPETTAANSAALSETIVRTSGGRLWCHASTQQPASSQHKLPAQIWRATKPNETRALRISSHSAAVEVAGGTESLKPVGLREPKPAGTPSRPGLPVPGSTVLQNRAQTPAATLDKHRICGPASSTWFRRLRTDCRYGREVHALVLGAYEPCIDLNEVLPKSGAAETCFGCPSGSFTEP